MSEPEIDPIDVAAQTPYAKLYNLPRDRQPDWLKRRLTLLDELIKNQSFLMDVEELRRHNYEKLPVEERTNLVVQLLAKYGADRDLYDVIYGFILEDEIDIFKVQPPVTYVSHQAKMLGPGLMPRAMYELYEKAGMIKPPTDAAGVALMIPPGTTKQDLIRFVQDFYDTHLKPGLELPADAPRRKRVRKQTAAGQEIARRDVAGQSAKEIADSLEGESRDYTSIRRTARNLRGEGSVDHSDADVSEAARRMILDATKAMMDKTRKPPA